MFASHRGFSTCVDSPPFFSTRGNFAANLVDLTAGAFNWLTPPFLLLCEGREFRDEFVDSIAPASLFCEKERGLFCMMSPIHHVWLSVMP